MTVPKITAFFRRVNDVIETNDQQNQSIGRIELPISLAVGSFASVSYSSQEYSELFIS